MTLTKIYFVIINTSHWSSIALFDVFIDVEGKVSDGALKIALILTNLSKEFSE